MVKVLEKGVRMHECAKQVSAKMYPHTFQYGYIMIYYIYIFMCRYLLGVAQTL